MLPRRLRSLTLTFSVAFLIATVGTGAVVYRVTLATIAEFVDRRVADVSSVAAGHAGDQHVSRILRRMEALAQERDTGDIGLQLNDADGRWLGGNIRLTRLPPVGRSSLHGQSGVHGLSQGRALVRLLPNGLRLTAVAETEPFDNYNAARIRIYLLGFGSIVLVVVGGMAAFGLLVHRRIAEMRQTADAIVDGDLRQRVPVTGAGGAFDQQALAFNRMLDRIAQLVNEVRNVSGDVAHDLRTPLARLRSRLALLLRHAEAPAQREGLEAALAQCDELMEMFAAVLRIAEIESGERRGAFEPLDLRRLAGDVVEMFQPVALDMDRQLQAAAGEELQVVGDAQLLTQAIVNLIENALRYTPPGSRIVVETSHTLSAATMSVADNGPGIPPEQRALALRRFGRLDASRHVEGHGLGLPLVEAIARLHGGTLTLADAAPGLRATLTIPIDNA